MKNTFIALVIIFLGLTANAQKYEIKVKVDGIGDTVVYLGYYVGKQTYVLDTVRLDNKGYAVFKGDKKLERGIYLIAVPVPRMTYFEFLMTDNQKFSLETKAPKFYDNMKVKNSKENEVFFEYQLKMQSLQVSHSALMKEYNETINDSVENRKVIEKMNLLNDERVSYMNSLIAKDPNSFFAKVLKSMLEIKVPDSPKDENGNVIDPNFQFLYLKEHYFDNLDFGESGFVRTPVYENIIDSYLKRFVVPYPDSLIKETHNIIQRTYDAGDNLMFQYTLTRFLNMYDTSKVMGYDAVFVAIAEDWFLSGKAKFAKEELISKISERVDKITPNKIGNIAPNLERMQGIDDKFYTLHKIQGEYTVLAFFEPGCGTCKKEMPKLFEEFKDTLSKLDVKVFAIYTQLDKEEWKKFIETNNLNAEGWYNVWDGPYPHSKFRDFYDIYSVPVIFILDKDKKIIGKRIGPEGIKKLIEYHKQEQEYIKNKK